MGTARRNPSQIEHLLQDLERVVWVVDSMANGAWILVDLVVVAALERLVAKEVDLVELDTVWQLCVGLDVLQAICLVPTCWEDVEGDLTADGVAGKAPLA
jgi:CheY-like chemotaxis protein